MISVTIDYKNMKAFLFDLVNKLQRTSNTLDAKAILCNKTWRVFSDTGEKEVYIFMEDGKLVISLNGSVDMGTWMYIPTNQSLVITGKQNYLVHPVICNNILALIVDGTNQCAFLLDDTKRELEAVKSLQNISSYISSNINKLPHISSAVNPNMPTTTNLSVLQNKEDDYAFGMFGQHDGDIWYKMDLRQLKRVSGQLARAKFTCDFLDPSKFFHIHAYSSDYNSEKDTATFKITLLEGVLLAVDYHSLATDARVGFCLSEKSFLGLNKKFKKVISYNLPNSKYVEDDANIWLNKYGNTLRKDIERYKSELVSLLGFSDIYGLFNKDSYIIT